MRHFDHNPISYTEAIIKVQRNFYLPSASQEINTQRGKGALPKPQSREWQSNSY